MGPGFKFGPQSQPQSYYLVLAPDLGTRFWTRPPSPCTTCCDNLPKMGRPLLLLLLFLLFLSLGADGALVGCGLGGDGSVGFACITSSGEDPCRYIVTVQATTLLAADSSPVSGATVTIGMDPPDSTNTRITDANGNAFWDDTSFLTGFSSECDGQDVGTVEPYLPDTSFSYDVLVSAPGLAPVSTILTIDRKTRDIVLIFLMEP